MNADTLQQHEDHGRRWATALLTIGVSQLQVKADAIRSRGMLASSYRLNGSSDGWRTCARIESGDLAVSCAFLAGAFAACEESTRCELVVRTRRIDEPWP